jgi:hypothetical protein
VAEGARALNYARTLERMVLVDPNQRDYNIMGGVEAELVYLNLKDIIEKVKKRKSLLKDFQTKRSLSKRGLVKKNVNDLLTMAKEREEELMKKYRWGVEGYDSFSGGGTIKRKRKIKRSNKTIKQKKYIKKIRKNMREQKKKQNKQKKNKKQTKRKQTKRKQTKKKQTKKKQTKKRH